MKFKYLIISCLCIYFVSISILTSKSNEVSEIDNLDISSQLLLMYINDQNDRAKIQYKESNFSFESLNKNDSIRVAKVFELDTLGLLSDQQDMLYASFIYLHSPEVEKQKFHKRGIELCDSIINSPIKDTSIYLYSADNFNKLKNNYGSIFEKLDGFNVVYLDNNVLVKIPLSARAKTIKDLHEKKLNSSNDDKVVIKSTEDFEKYKEILREKTIRQLQDHFPNKKFTDEEISVLLKKQFDMLQEIFEKAKKEKEEMRR